MAYDQNDHGHNRLSFIDKEIIARTVVVVLVRGAIDNNTNERYYAYVAVRAANLDKLLAAQQHGEYDIRDFGAVLEAGKGDPAPDVMLRIEKAYGFNHEKGITLSEN